MSCPALSIIITTKNEEKNIGNCLESIKAQTYPQEKIEIIVVDNNSSDKTKEIAKEYTKKIYNKGPERSAQRNYGMIEKAKGKYVMFLDADMILSATVIEKAIEKLESSSATLVALYIPEIVLGDSFWNQVRRFERSFYDGTAIDCVRIIRKDVFEKVGGFDLSLTGPEDWDLDKKVRQARKAAVLCKYNFEEINKKLKRIEISGNMVAKGDRNSLVKLSEIKKLMNLIKEPVIYHNETEFNLKKYLKKKRYYSRSFDKYIKKWDKNDPDIKKQFGLWYRYFGVFIENGKWKKLIKHSFLTMGMYFLRGAVGIIYLINLNESNR